jgi:hypothetical protein
VSVEQPGVYDIPEDEYHADPVPGGSLSSSGARRLLPPSCPAIFRYEQDHPVRKDVFDFGSAAHKLVLGAGPVIVVVDAEDWRTRAAKERREDIRDAGAIPLLRAEHAQVQAMALAIRRHPIASVLFDPSGNGRPEQSLFWQDPETGVWCRARPDWLPDTYADRRLIIPDYKTTVSASPEHITKAVGNLGYHQQDAWYTDGARALGLDDDPAFIFVFQEKTPPYLVTVVQLDEDARRAGRARNRLAIERYRDCTESGIWPGHSDEIEFITLPAWATRTEEYA